MAPNKFSVFFVKSNNGVNSVPVIRTPVNRTFVIRKKYIPYYPDSPDNGIRLMGNEYSTLSSGLSVVQITRSPVKGRPDNGDRV